MSKKLIPEKLHFEGPYKFSRGNKYLFASPFANKEGIYLWTIKDEVNNLNLIEYVGQSPSFADRQKYHLIQILGLNYRIINATSARQGKLDIIWEGLWRKKNVDAVSELLERYKEINDKVKEYVDLINIYFAETTVDTNMRCHIEGSIAWNLRNKFPQFTTFYPADNHIGTQAEKNNVTIKITMDEPIDGIPEVLKV
jgi:hypothetical protein